jgi:hypothetical protein
MLRNLYIKALLFIFWCNAWFVCGAQSVQVDDYWHGKERQLHYAPFKDGFKLVHGKRKFNRALYGTNTGFRVETGDLPEFALYLPGMGGNIRFGLVNGTETKWLIHADSIETVYRPERMEYVIRDRMLGSGSLIMEAVSMFEEEGFVLKVTANELVNEVKLICIYGGVSGKKFSRDGDVGADPESVWYLQPSYCSGNNIRIGSGRFTITDHYEEHVVSGSMPEGAEIKAVDFSQVNELGTALRPSANINAPVLVSSFTLQSSGSWYYQWAHGAQQTVYTKLEALYNQSVDSANRIGDRVKLHTPDEWLNNLGAVLANAGNAIWDSPTYMHGAVAWRMRLPAWRGANVADPLGWHDRAHTHFSSYAKSQLVTPEYAPVVMDTALHLARHLEKIGTGMFTSGYICRNPNGDIRPHHYDMNLVFIDQLLSHFEWTGDTAFLRQMWPVMVRHLDWEKRNFDSDSDGLYDAYCCIWASDALQYSGGGVTHSSSYNYRAFSKAAKLASILGYDGTAYRKEAENILNALQSKLWLTDKGWFAEYKDLLGKKLLHPSAGLWTIYHAMDSKVPDAFQAYQMMRYVDTEIPHIPVKAKGLTGNYHVLSTTNWMPYTWSVNNVAIGELMHTSLAYWQAGRNRQAFSLWKSTLVESMYNGASPGSFHQLLYYDAIRGELYRDFADGVGMSARALVEGLFGIRPDALADTLLIVPGYPVEWAYAQLKIPDLKYDYRREGKTDSYKITQHFTGNLNLILRIKARSTILPKVTLNGKPLTVGFREDAVGDPILEIPAGKADAYEIEVNWQQVADMPLDNKLQTSKGQIFEYAFGDATVLELYDPQNVLKNIRMDENGISGLVSADAGHKTLFIKVKQQDAKWWKALDLEVLEPVRFSGYTIAGDRATLSFELPPGISADLMELNEGNTTMKMSGMKWNVSWQVAVNELRTGTNILRVKKGGKIIGEASFHYWQKQVPRASYEPVNISSFFNAKVTEVFEQQYLSPRPVGPTLQLPWQGFGNWCYPLATPLLSDSGFREKAVNNFFASPFGFGFVTPAQKQQPNIAFVSQWDNYPEMIEIPLKGAAKHAFFLMAGTTNHMQSRLENARIVLHYTDGTMDALPLVNPENWWPIEQDYYEDGYAFTRKTARPPRVKLQDGSVYTKALPKYSSIKGVTGMAVEGGAATILDIPLNPKKQLKKLTLQAIANDVVVGLLGITLVR